MEYSVAPDKGTTLVRPLTDADPCVRRVVAYKGRWSRYVQEECLALATFAGLPVLAGSAYLVSVGEELAIAEFVEVSGGVAWFGVGERPLVPVTGDDLSNGTTVEKLVDRRATTWVRHLQQGSTYWLTAQGRRQLQDPDGRPVVVAGSESIAATFLRIIPAPPNLPSGLVFEIEGVEVAVRPHFMPVMVSTQRP